MAEYIEAKWDKVVQNLCDAGCESEDIQRFVQVLEAGQYREALYLLKKHRQILLDRCHAEERRIGCLDYLSYQIENNRVQHYLNEER